MKDRLKNILKYLAFSSIGGFFLYLAFRKTEWSKLMADFAEADYRYIILSILMGYAAFISRGIRWNYLLEPLGKKANTWNAIHAISMGYFANAVVPRAGELIRCTSLKSTDDIPLERLIGTVVLERVIDAFMLLSIIGFTFIIQLGNLQQFFAETMSGSSGGEEGTWGLKTILLGGLILVVILLFLLRRRIQELPIFAKVREVWQGFKEGFKSLSKLEKKWAFIGHTLFIWSMYYLMIYVVVFALPATEHITISMGFFIMVAGGMGMVIPSPGGIGSYHYLVMMACVVLGIAQADGLSFATLVHGGQMVMTFLAGFIAMPFIFRARKRLKAQQA